MAMLDVTDLAVTYRQGTRSLPAVKGVDLSVDHGQVLGIAGESGSGKSTVALSLLRLLPQGTGLTGSVKFQGEELTSATWGRMRAVRWAEASMVFQGAMSALNPVRTISDQIAEPIRLHEKKLAEREIRHRVDELLESVGVPVQRRKAYPHQLSGGQRQRVMIAMALACRPDLIIADEPTTALDVMVQAQVISLLTELVAGSQIGVIIISHDLALLAEVCDHLMVMYAGRVVESGPARGLFDEPHHPYTRALSRAFPRVGDPASRRAPQSLPGEPPEIGSNMTGCSFAPRCDLVLPECRTQEVDTRTDEDGRRVACIRSVADVAVAAATSADIVVAQVRASQPTPLDTPGPEPVAGASPPALEVRDLHISHPARRGGGVVRAVDGVDLTVGRGEIVALIGESGCGKSTLARALVGLARPDQGAVLYDGEPLDYAGSALKRYRRSVQLVLQDPGGALNPRQNVYDAVAEGLRLHGITDSLNGRVHRALSRAGLRPPAEFVARFPHRLSGGQQQRVVIAGALALEPSVIVADEPVSSLDASARGEILRLLLDLRDDPGLSALVVSHDLGLAWNIADRVAVMYLGRIVEVGTVDEVLLSPKHPYTQALLSVLPGSLAERRQVLLAGEPPDAAAIPPGCRFQPRCPAFAALAPEDPVRELCRTRSPSVLAGTGVPSSLAACHLIAAGTVTSPTTPAEPTPAGPATRPAES